mgnify:CR=1 FL=1
MKKAFETVTAFVEDVSALLRGLVMLGIVVGILFDDYFGVVAAIGELTVSYTHLTLPTIYSV